MRPPHDNAVIVPSVDDAAAATLPVESYMALRLPAGTHRLSASKVGAPKTLFATLAVELKGGERRFFYLSTALPNSDHGSGAAGAAVGANFGPVAQVVVTAFAEAMQARPKAEGFGSYRWVECADLDAQGLASISGGSRGWTWAFQDGDGRC